MRYETISRSETRFVPGVRKSLEYIPLTTDPSRVYLPRVQKEEKTPLRDFVLSWGGYFEVIAAMAAIALTIMCM